MDPGRDVTHWFELSVAPWISTTVCDPDSAPLLPCTPRSDGNAPRGKYLGGGAGFVELQFYPPGFAPFADTSAAKLALVLRAQHRQPGMQRRRHRAV